LFASLSSITTVQAAQLTWTVETVDYANDVGYFTSIAIDSVGNLHVSYWDQYWNDLKYAKLVGSTWTTMPVDHVGEIGFSGTSIQVDSANNPHISYYDYTNEDLKYARWTGSDWNLETVDSTGIVGLHSSLALDSSNRAHISYYDYVNEDLKYAHWTGSSWSFDTVDSTGASGVTSSLALDSGNRPHIAYWQIVSSDASLKYARWTGSSWSFETVETGGIGAESVSLKLDSSDNPHISYCETFGRNLKYAKKIGSTWNKEIVDASDTVGLYSSLALDSNDSPHIAYYDGYWDDLKYAKLTDYGWFVKNVDNVGVVGRYTSMVLDSTDHPRIVYCDNTNRNLKYARDPDENFYSVTYSSFDNDGDLKDDAVEAVIDVDTTHSGALNVFVFGYLSDSGGNPYGFNSSSWQIISSQYEPEKLIFILPPEASEDNYDLHLQVTDDSQTLEDIATINDVAYLYPSETGSAGTLAGTVTDFDTGLPMQSVEIYVDESPAEGTYRAETNAAGQYSIELTEGEHEIWAHDSEGSLYFDESANVNIIHDVVTTQDFQLQRKNYVLSISTIGPGTTEPDLGAITFSMGSLAEVHAYPEQGCILSHWILDQTNVGNENPYTLTMDSDHSLKATFIESTPIMVESSNSAGDQMDYFEVGATVYIVGSGYSASTTYNLYVVEDVPTWIDSMTIPTRVPGTVPTISSNSEGTIPATVAWSNPQIEGKFDIVIDVNNNGVYNPGVDALDDNDIEVTAGMVIPELSPFSFLLLFSILAIFAVLACKGSRKK
jgi:hypothetical protein